MLKGADHAKNGWSSYIDQRADADWLPDEVRSEPAPGLRADGDGGSELLLPVAAEPMSGCARGWWSWRGRSRRASGIGGCMIICWAVRGSM